MVAGRLQSGPHQAFDGDAEIVQGAAPREQELPLGLCRRLFGGENRASQMVPLDSARWAELEAAGGNPLLVPRLIRSLLNFSYQNSFFST